MTFSDCFLAKHWDLRELPNSIFQVSSGSWRETLPCFLCTAPVWPFHVGEDNISAVICLLERPVKEADSLTGAEGGWIWASSGRWWWWALWTRRCWCRVSVSWNVSHSVYFALLMTRQAQGSLPTASPEHPDHVAFVQFWSLPKLEVGQVSGVDSGSKYKLCFPFGRWVWGICSFSACKCMAFCLDSWGWEDLEYVDVIPHFVVCCLHTVCTSLFSA